MKAWEICKQENQWKIYKCNDKEWKVIGIDLNGEFYDLQKVSTREILTDSHFLSQIAEMDFEEIVEVI
ncbi:TPA: hypothetical protein PTW06_003624 [Clostridium botulinum]|uniref:Uncharacterized protein n=1 Tax=Clostridium botulinum B2 450 TaxID=1379739 RepID=A0A0D1BSC4_CLOBO|nr:hypothetical protein [Clostridium botulinum]KIS21706.1 hypothetical protein N495_20140 [Clostridium botulinum B2 450]HDK7180808.1 hypothetical protein [Clostridium botulinum]HDK7226295.1 hypothetical protein [Clostridium botulinum]HDK7273685.1 hypothetical protein [Clostridium botulinum]HDK7307033.1 hypothetical protein [Clostridium botulinum]